MEERALSYHVINPFDLAENQIDEDNIEQELTRIDNQLLEHLVPFAQLITELYSGDNVQIDFPEIRRSETEFKGGYRIAISKGAFINQVKVHNLFFRISSNRINTIIDNPVGQMYTTGKGERWILLHPDDTQARIDKEKTYYLNKIIKLGEAGKIDTSALKYLNDNLCLLNVNERCAQTLIHEYGHIVHWREFDHLFDDLGVANTYPEMLASSKLMMISALSWFTDHGYIFNVANRVPGFSTMSLPKKLHYLKESFVEDYRILLNMKSNDGMMILPNAYCAPADIIDPDQLIEGVRIVDKMLKEAKWNNTATEAKSTRRASEMELDRTVVAECAFDIAINTGWKPGYSSLSKWDVEAMIDELTIDLLRSSYSEVAVTTEKEQIIHLRKI